MEVSIRHGIAEDRWREYKELRLEALRNEPLAFSPGIEAYAEYTDTDWQDELNRIQSPPNTVLFAERADAKTLVGMSGIRFYQSPRFQHNAGLQALYVSSDVRGLRVGKQLVSEALHVIASNDHIENVVCEIISSQKASLELHKKLGFEVVGTYHDFMYYEGNYHDNHFLQKWL